MPVDNKPHCTGMRDDEKQPAMPGYGEWLCEACDTMQDADTKPDGDGCCPACVVAKEKK